MKNQQTLQFIVLIMAAGAVCAVAPASGQEAKPAVAQPAEKPAFPSVLPGKGLAQHDFFYAGEAKSQDM